MPSSSTSNLVLISGILFVAVALQLSLQPFSPLPSFGALQIPTSPPPFQSNSKLQEVVKLGEGVLKQPEAVAVDGKGTLYTATRDGWIKRLLRNGTTWESWRHVDSDGLLGIAPTEDGDLFVCDADKGLHKIGDGGVTVAATHVNGDPIRFADDVAVSSEGKVYFSIASRKFDFHHWPLDILEPTSTGQLIQFEPSTDTASVLVDNLGFANGVVLSENQDYIVVCETWKFRCLKYVLKGEEEGKTEIFIDNLPGGPDNINLAPDGTFWIALLQLRPSWWLRYIPEQFLKSFSKIVEFGIGVHNAAMVVNVASDGRVIRGFDDPTGKVIAKVTSAIEFDGHLYLGTLHNDFVGKLPLTAAM
ncbi:protein STRICTOSIDINE SYNTHASE-LIKE 4-like [Andrographis paniculata]|uniref:protein STRICTOSIDINE SYNTHASE-LIKE 4-like n=1 Tax=Andrographis paniculata TaxID=175694 RepID=UPI0021E755B5|nr:protein STRICTOSIDINE SYNTHASE-LIKE 4-like [Andrographis paniculata]